MEAAARRFTGLLLVALAAGLTGCMSPTFHGRGVQYIIEPEYSVDDPQFLRSLGHLLGPEITAGNRVKGFINGDQIFPAMLEAINGAKKSVTLESYIYWSGEVGDKFSKALAERAKAGVKVHVLFDWVGSRKIDSSQIDAMEVAGVQVERYNPLRWYNPLEWYKLPKLNHRDHRKLLIVDGKIGFTGGAGLADIWMGNADSPEHWRDSQFRLEGPAVAEMQSVFADNWLRASARLLDGPDYFPELDPVGGHYAQMFKSSPRESAESVRLMYLLSFAAARKSIRISVPYFVPGPLTTEELVAACLRGVKVEIIVPGARTDAAIVRHASRAKWGPLLAAGVKIYEYEPTMYHCKMMVVDDLWVSVGSANFDNRSFRLNDEANLNVFAADFALEQAKVFEADKLKAHEVTYREWRDRSFWKRLEEVFAAPFRTQL